MGGFIGDITDTLGITDIEGQQDAAKDAAWTQAQSGKESIALQRESRDIARGDLSPFVGFATGNFGAPAVAPVAQIGNPLINRNRVATPTQEFIPGSSTNPGPGYTSSSPMGRYSALLDPANQASFLESNPMFKAALANTNLGIRNQGYMTGLKGDMQSQLMQNYMGMGNQFIDAQINRLLQPIQIGQASAAGQANTALTSGQSIGNTMTDIGNARAAGIIGAGNAHANAMSGLLQAGAMLGGAAMSDRRMKRDIHEVLSDDLGGVYEFRYVGSDQRYVGRMADELQKTRPDAVFMGDDGFLRVTAEFAPRAI